MFQPYCNLFAEQISVHQPDHPQGNEERHDFFQISTSCVDESECHSTVKLLKRHRFSTGNVAALCSLSLPQRKSTLAFQLVREQKQFYLSGATKDIEFRKKQLRILRRALDQNRESFADAIYADLRRPAELTNRYEIDASVEEIDIALAHVDEWAKAEVVAAVSSKVQLTCVV